MGEVIRLEMNDALYNAGLLGFIKVCRYGGLPFKTDRTGISFSTDIFADFGSCYLETLIDCYRDDMVFTEIIRRFDSLPSQLTEDTQKQANDHIKYILDKLSRASYKSAYEIIKKAGDCYPFADQAGLIKKADCYENKLNLLSGLIKKLKEHEDVFLLKDIAYTRLQPFWSNVSFLNKNKNTDDFLASYEEAFSDPASAFIPKEATSAKLSCCQCHNGLKSSEALSMAWINDLGVDIKRKTSYYWNLNPDTWLCPVCNLVYSCIPLGFIIKGTEAIFINKNSSLRELEQTMARLKIMSPDNDSSNLYYRILNEFIALEVQSNAEHETDNVQVVRHSGGHYYYNILSKEKLQVILDGRAYLGRLEKIYYMIDDTTLNLYQETIHRIFTGCSLYPFISRLAFDGIKNNRSIGFIINLVQLQVLQSNPSGKGAGKMSDKTYTHVALSGDTLRKAMLSNERNEKKIASLTFQLLNSLKNKNPNKFSDILLRQYMSMNLDVPFFMTEIFNDENIFLSKGYSFIAGLNGCIYNGKSEDTIAANKEENS